MKSYSIQLSNIIQENNNDVILVYFLLSDVFHGNSFPKNPQITKKIASKLMKEIEYFFLNS